MHLGFFLVMLFSAYALCRAQTYKIFISVFTHFILSKGTIMTVIINNIINIRQLPFIRLFHFNFPIFSVCLSLALEQKQSFCFNTFCSPLNCYCGKWISIHFFLFHILTVHKNFNFLPKWNTHKNNIKHAHENKKNQIEIKTKSKHVTQTGKNKWEKYNSEWIQIEIYWQCVKGLGCLRFIFHMQCTCIHILYAWITWALKLEAPSIPDISIYVECRHKRNAISSMWFETFRSNHIAVQVSAFQFGLCFLILAHFNLPLFTRLYLAHRKMQFRQFSLSFSPHWSIGPPTKPHTSSAYRRLYHVSIGIEF